MPAYQIDGPGGKTYTIDGPEGATDEQLIRVLKAQLAQPAPQSSYLEDAYHGTTDYLKQSLRGVAGLFGHDTATQAAIQAHKDAQEDAQTRGPGSLERISAANQQGGLGAAAAETARQIPHTVAENVGPLAAQHGLGLAGAAAGSLLGPVGAAVGTGVGEFASLYPSVAAQNMQQQVAVQQAAGQTPDVDRLSAYGMAVPQTAIMAAARAYALGKSAVKGILGMGEEEIAKDSAAAAAKLVAQSKQTLARAAVGHAAEATAVGVPTMVANKVMERAQAGQDVLSPDAIHDYGQAAAGAALLMPAVGAYGGARGRSDAQARVADQQQAAQAAQQILAQKQAEATAAQEALDKQQPEYLDGLQKRYQDLLEQRAQAKAALGPPPSKEAQVADPAAYLAWQEKSKAHAAGLKDPDTEALIREVADRKADIDALNKQREEAQADATATAKQAEASKGVPETTGAIAPDESGETVPTPAITATFGQAQAMHQDAVKRAGEAARAGDFDAAQKAQDEATHHAEVMNTLKRLQTQEAPPEPPPPPAPIPRDPLTDELTKRLQQLQGGTTKKGNPIDGLYVKAVRLGDNEGAAAHLAEMRQIQQKLATRQATLDEMNSRGEDLNKQQSAPNAGTDMSGYTEGLRHIDDAGQELRVDHDIKQMQANRMNTGKTEQVSLFPAEPSKTTIYQQSRDTLTQAFRDARKSGDRNAMAKVVEDIRLYDAAQQMNGPKKQLAHRVTPLTGNAVESKFTPKSATPESVKAQMDALPAATTPRRDLASMTGTKPNGEEAQAVAQRLGRNVDGKANAPAVDAQTESLLQRLRDNFNAFTADPARTEMAAEWLHGLRTRRATHPVADEMHADVGRSRDIAAELDRLEQGKRSETENGRTAVQGDLLDGVPSKSQTTTNKNGISGEIAGEEPPTRGTVFKTPEEFANFMTSDALHEMRASVGPVRQTLARAVARIEALKKQLTALGAEAKKLTDRQNLLQRGKDTRTAETTAQYDAAMKRLNQVMAGVEAELQPTHANIENLRAALEDSARRSAEISATIEANMVKYGGESSPEFLRQLAVVTDAKNELMRALNKEVTKANWDVMCNAQDAVIKQQQKLQELQNASATDAHIKRFLNLDLEQQLKLQAEGEHANKLRDDMQGLQDLATHLRTIYEGLHGPEIAKAKAGVDAAKRAAELAATKNEPKLAAVAEKQRANANEAAGVGEQIKAEEASVGRTPEQRARDEAPPPEPIDPKLQAAMDKIAAERAAMKPFEITPTHIAVQKDSIAKAREKAGQEPLSAAELTKQAEEVLKQRAKDFGNEPYTQDQLRRLGEEELANQQRREHQTHLEAVENPVDADGNPLPREQVNNEAYRKARDNTEATEQRIQQLKATIANDKKSTAERDSARRELKDIENSEVAGTREGRKAQLRNKADDESLPQTTRNKAQHLWLGMEREDKARENTKAAQAEIETLANEKIPHLRSQVDEADVKNPTKEQKKLLTSRRKELSKAQQRLTKLAKLVQRGKRTNTTPDASEKSIPELIAQHEDNPSEENAAALKKARDALNEQLAINAQGMDRLEHLQSVEIPQLKNAYTAKPSIEARDALQAAIREARELTAQAHQRAPMERPERIAGNILTGDLTTTGERVVPQGVPVSQGRAAKGKGTKVGKKEQQAANAIADEIGVTTPRKTEDKAVVAKAEAETKAADIAKRLADKEAEIALLQKQLPRAEESAEKAESRVGITPEARDALRNRPDALRKLIAEKESERDALKAQQDEANKPVAPTPEPAKEPQANREDAEAALADHELESYDDVPDPKTGNYDDFAGEYEGHAFRTTDGGGHGMHVDDVRTAVEDAIKGWTNVPEIKYVQSEGELPLRIQGYIKKTANEGNVPAVRDGITGKVWMIGDNIKDARDATLSIVHEVAGHHGLREMLGNTYNDVMNRVYNGNEAVRAAADAKMKANDTLHKELAVEEVMADMAEKNPKSNVLKQVFYAVKGWLYKKFGFKGVSDGEVAQIVANARRYVETVTGPQTGGGGDRRMPAMRKKESANDMNAARDILIGSHSTLADLKENKTAAAIAAHQSVFDGRSSARRLIDIVRKMAGGKELAESADKSLSNVDALSNMITNVLDNGAAHIERDALGHEYITTGKNTGIQPVLDAIKALPGADANAKWANAQVHMDVMRAQNMTNGWQRLLGDGPEAAAKQAAILADHARFMSDPANKAAMEHFQDMLHAYNKPLMLMLGEMGFLPKAVATRLANNRNYTPWLREMDNSIQMFDDHGKNVYTGDIRKMPFLQALRGGEAKLLPMQESLFKNTAMLTGMAVKNFNARQMGKVVEKVGKAANVMQTQEGQGPAGEDIVRWKDEPTSAADTGDRWTRLNTAGTLAEHIPTPLLAQAMAGSYSQLPSTFLGKMGSFAGSLVRAGTVRNPGYLFTLMVKDPLYSSLTGNLKSNPLMAVVKNFHIAYQIARGSNESFKALSKMGALPSHIYSSEAREMSKIALNYTGKSANLPAQLGKMVDRWAHIADASSRVQAFDDIIKAGGSVVEGATAAQSLRDFGRRGSSASIQAVAHFVPFFGAEMSALDTMARSMRGTQSSEQLLNTKKQFFTRMIGMSAMAMAYIGYMNQNDKEWADTPIERKIGYIPLGFKYDGHAVGMPTPFQAGAFAWSLPVALSEMMAGRMNTPTDKQALWNLLKNELPGRGLPIPAFAKGAIESIANYDFGTGRPIISKHNQGVDASQRRDPNTTEAAMMMASALRAAGATNVSGPDVEHLATAYFGQLPHLIAGMTNQLFAEHNHGEVPDLKPHQLPFVGRFINDTRSDVVEKAQDNAARAKEAFNTVNDMKSKGNAKEAMQFLQEKTKELGPLTASQGFQRIMSQIRKNEEAIKNGPGTSAEKRKRIDAIEEVKAQKARDYLKGLENFRAKQVE